jgi:mono/diheme cytochrome c family protein
VNVIGRIVPFVLVLACGAASTDLVPGTGNGATIYATYCVLCHGKDGKLGLNGAKDLTRSPLTREEMIAVVTNGRNMMQPYKEVLTAAEIAAAVDHVRSFAPRTE